jgi:hypothetical protein
MPGELIQHWLEKKIKTHIVVCWAGAVLALLAGGVVLFLTFWLAYLVLYIGEFGVSAMGELVFNHALRLTHSWRILICGLFLAALFAEWLRRSPEDLGNYGEIKAPAGARALVLYDGAMGAFAMLLDNPQASATMITDILCVGPRLVLGTVALVRAALRWRQFNAADCAWVLQSLVYKGSAVGDDEFCAGLEGRDWNQLKRVVAQLPGVVFLEKGLSLTEDFRREMLAVAADQ